VVVGIISHGAIASNSGRRTDQLVALMTPPISAIGDYSLPPVPSRTKPPMNDFRKITNTGPRVLWLPVAPGRWVLSRMTPSLRPRLHSPRYPARRPGGRLPVNIVSLDSS
jgi:hypothetical protein